MRVTPETSSRSNSPGDSGALTWRPGPNSDEQPRVLPRIHHLQQPADRGHADRIRLGAGQQQPAQLSRRRTAAGCLTKSPSSRVASTSPRSVTPSEKRTCRILQRSRRVSSRPRAARPATTPADGGLHQRRKHVVRTGGEGNEIDVPRGTGQRPVGAVAAQRHQRADAGVEKSGHGRLRVPRIVPERGLQHVHPGRERHQRQGHRGNAERFFRDVDVAHPPRHRPPAATRATMSRFASCVMLVARAARRRTSRPDMGFTQMAIADTFWRIRPGR